MTYLKIITRILIWSFIVICLFIACFLYFFGDINKLKNAVEENLKNQFTCTIKLGDLDWDWDGLNLGVTTSEITLFDKENNLVLRGGPTRFVWHLKNIITGSYSHFYSIESTNLYLNAIRNENNIWNLIAIFPPGPLPKVDNLRLNNSIIYLIDELNPTSKKVLYKDFNVRWEKKLFSNLREIYLTTRVGTLTSSSFLRVKGSYSERKKFDWKKNQIHLSLIAKKINLANLHGFLVKLVKEPELKKLDGEFTGKVYLHKHKNKKEIKLRSVTKTNNFLIELQNKGISELIEIPKTDLVINALIDKNKISIKSYRSNINELTYEVTGYIFNWSTPLPEADLQLKTNKFNFKSVKPYLPLSLLPADTRARIEPIKDDGFVELDLKLKGPAIAPKYYGTILLDKFNLTKESGFLTVIQGLKGKLILDDEILKIEELDIPIEDSLLILKGEVDNKELKTSFNLSGKNLHIYILQDLLFQSGFKPPLSSEIQSNGKLDLNVDVNVIRNAAPEIKGNLSFHDAGFSILQEELLEIKNIFGDLSLDGSRVIFNKLNGLINNESFFINGGFSLKEDETISLSVYAEHLKIIRYILSFISSKTPFRPVAETISGEASNLNLNIGGSFSKPVLNGMVLINNVSFSLPNFDQKISNIIGSLRFEGTELVIEELSGKIQDSDFSIAGYIENLFAGPKPKLRLVAENLELNSFWKYIKEQLKTTSLSVQAQELEKLNGFAFVDIFLHPDAVLGNIYFKDAELKYKPIPFGLNNLSGRVVIGEKNISLFDLMGSVNNSNNFNCDLTIYNYLDPAFYIQGQLNTDLDLPSALKAINAPALNTINIDGLIPTIVNFDISWPLVKAYFSSTLNEMLNLELPPYIKKPVDKAYFISGNVDFNTKDMDLYLSQFNIRADKLSITTNGNIKNVSSKNPEIMLYFSTDEPCGVFMIIEPITPLMGYKVWGMIELSGSVSGTPTMYAVSTNATVTDIRIPDLLGKKLKATDGVCSLYLDNEQGVLNSKVNNLNYISLVAKSVSLSLNYLNPIIYLNELSLDGNPGSIYAVGSYDPSTSAISFLANGSDLDLSSLGSFIFLDPTKVSGITNFSLMIDTKGKTKNEILSNANGNLSFSVKEGKLGQVALLQKGLKIANLFGQGIFGFNLTNVFSLFFQYQDGSFNTIDGELDLSKGIVKEKEFHYRAKDLFLNSFGFIDLVNSFIGLSFYGYLPEKEEKDTQHSHTNSFKGALSISPEALNKRRIVIPFLHLTPPQYFKFEVKGDLKNQKKITRRTARSFRWLRGKRLQKELQYAPKT